MKTAIVFLFLGVTAFAQQSERFGHQPPPQVPLPSSCGPDAQSFNVALDDSRHSLIAPQAGTATLYFVDDDGSGVGGALLGSPTTRYALDGAWVGANHGESWFSVAVAPGDHHVCTALQSSFFQGVEVTHFNAEPGKSYFFRTRLFAYQTNGLLEFAPIDSDEADYLISLYPMATATAKK
jgi:hypothetical protein